MRTMQRVHAPLPSAKQLQHAFREEAKEFVRAKRREADRICLLYWEEEGGIERSRIRQRRGVARLPVNQPVKQLGESYDA